jgi:DNA-binding Xre family transcriptional regulator
VGISFTRLWVILAERGLRASDLGRACDISASTLSRMRGGHGVEMSVLEKVCAYLEVDFGQIMEYVPESPKKKK